MQLKDATHYIDELCEKITKLEEDLEAAQAKNERLKDGNPALFKKVFPDGVKLSRVGKHGATHHETIKKAVKSTDIEYVREVLIAMVWGYSMVVDSNRRISETAIALSSENARLLEAITNAAKVSSGSWRELVEQKNAILMKALTGKEK